MLTMSNRKKVVLKKTKGAMISDELVRIYTVEFENKFQTAAKKYGVMIKRHKRSFYCADPILLKKYDGFTFEQYMKWKWFFRYVAAKAQIETPKNFIEICEYDYAVVDQKEVKLLIANNRLKNAKSKVTKFSNSIRLARENWNLLFPIEDDDMYKKAILKLHSKEREVEALQDFISLLQSE